MGYKMKGFSGFKESPVKQKGDNLKRIMSANKAAQKKAGTWYAPGADPAKKPTSTGYKPHKVGTYDGRDVRFIKRTSPWEAKWARNAPKHAAQKQAMKESIKKVGSKALRVAGKAAGALAIPATLHDFYKSGQKHSGGKAVKGQKPFMEESKKKTKSIYKKK